MSDILQCLEAAGPAAADPGGIISAVPFMNAADAVCLCREAVTAWGRGYADQSVHGGMRGARRGAEPLSARAMSGWPMWPGNLPTTGGQYR